MYLSTTIPVSAADGVEPLRFNVMTALSPLIDIAQNPPPLSVYGESPTAAADLVGSPLQVWTSRPAGSATVTLSPWASSSDAMCTLM